MENSGKNNDKRVRSLTQMTLTWLAERLRKQQKVKESVKNGNYQVSSQTIAKSMLNSAN